MPVPQTIALEGSNPVITLADGASGALIPLPAEAILRTFQQGDDLILILADGNRIAIADFFALEDPSLILRDPSSGDYIEVSLGEDGNIIGQQPRSLSELAEMFDASAAEIAELQGAQAAEASASGTAWTMNTGVAAASVGVLAAIGAAVSGSDSDTDTSTGTTDATDSTGSTGSTDSTETGTTALEGVVVDGYIAGARVFQDLDADGEYDDGEPTTMTGTEGRFALEQTNDSDPLVAVGGTDTSTGQALTGLLTAPAGSDVISPLTTLVQSLVETQASGDNPISVAEANEQLASALGLSGSNLLELDPIAQLDTSATAYVASSQVAAVISTTAAAAPEDERAAASEAAAAQLAEQLLATDQPDATAVLQNQDAVQQIIQAALVEATDIVPAEAEVTAEAIAEKVVDANARLDSAADGDAAQETIEAVQQVIQGDLVAAIADEDTEVGSIDLGARVEAALAALTGDQAGPDGGTQPEGNQTDGDETDGNQTDGDQTDGNQQGPDEVVPSTTGQGTEDDDGDDGDPDSPDPDAGAGGPEPVNSPGSVTIAGTVAEGQELQATVSDEDGLPAGAAGYSYQWQRGDGSGGFANIGGATQSTYTLGDADVGQTVRVQVSYTDGNGTSESVTSAASAVVTNVNDLPTGSVAISGSVTEGAVLTADTAGLADNDGLPADAAGYSYQWQRNTGANGDFENIANATGQTYTLGDDDVDQTVRVAVRYTDGNGTSESVTSAASAVVTNVNDLPTGSVAISGSVTEGAVLTADTAGLADNDGLPADAAGYSYQWQRNTGADGEFENIANATARTYTLGDADVDQTVRVQVRYTDGQGTAESLTSAASAVVTNVNDLPTGSVTLSGTATEGETLSAETDNLGDNDGLGDLSYQWQRSTDSGIENIPNASQSTYTLGDADVGRTVQVQVRYTDGNGTPETLTSAATAAVTNVNDQPTGSVTLSGTATEGETLSAETETLGDNDGLGDLSYQWQRSTDSGIENIPNASQSTYTLGDADVGRTVQVQVRYTDGNGTPETLTSDASTVVTNVNDLPTGSVAVSGTASEGAVLTADISALRDADGLPEDADGYSYQWQRNTGADGDFENIANATARTYTLGDADVGQTVRVQVRYTDGNNTPESVTSVASAVVTNVNDQPSGSVAVNGSASEGAVLTADTAALVDNDGLPDAADYSYQWQRGDGSGGFGNIAGETARTYTLGDADVDQTVRVQVRYTDGNGTPETVSSDATAAVTNVNDLPTGSVTISGDVREDAELTADISALRDADGLPEDADGYSYQWQRSDGSGGFDDIAGATGETYTLGDDDVGQAVQVQVSYTDGNNTSESVTSDATAVVTNINDQPTGSVAVNGSASEGAVLTADTAALVDNDGLPADTAGYSYQWQRSTDSGVENIPNASQSTYTLGDADVGRTVQVQVRYTDGNGTAETLTSDATNAVTNINDNPAVR